MNNADFWTSIKTIVDDGFIPEGLQKLNNYAELFIKGWIVLNRFSSLGCRAPLNVIKYNEHCGKETRIGYCDTYQPHAVRRIYDSISRGLYDLRWSTKGSPNGRYCRCCT